MNGNFENQNAYVRVKTSKPTVNAVSQNVNFKFFKNFVLKCYLQRENDKADKMTENHILGSVRRAMSVKVLVVRNSISALLLVYEAQQTLRDLKKATYSSL